MSAESIDHRTLAELIEAGAIRQAIAVANGRAWALRVRYGAIEKTLRATNSRAVRTWSRLDSLIRYLRELGIRECQVDARNYDPDQAGTQRRPDRAAALRRAHEAVSGNNAR
jgi:hypothetical protein